MRHLYPETRPEKTPFDSSGPQSFVLDHGEQPQWICLSGMHTVIAEVGRILTVPLLCKHPPAVFKKKDVRLMGLNDFESSYESRPGFRLSVRSLLKKIQFFTKYRVYIVLNNSEKIL
jgi:hypothetical protein